MSTSIEIQADRIHQDRKAMGKTFILSSFFFQTKQNTPFR